MYMKINYRDTEDSYTKSSSLPIVTFGIAATLLHLMDIGDHYKAAWTVLYAI